MNHFTKLHSNHTRILRLAVASMTCLALLVLLWQAMPVIDSYTSAQAYAYGNVQQGYLSQVEGARLVDRERDGALAQLGPLALQGLGVLSVAIVLDIDIRRMARQNNR